MPRCLSQTDPVLAHNGPPLLSSEEGSARGGIDEIGDRLINQARPFGMPPGVFVELPQSLHCSDYATPPTIGPSQLPRVQQIRFLRFQCVYHIAIPTFVLAKVPISELPSRLYKCANRSDARFRVVLLEKASERTMVEPDECHSNPRPYGQKPRFGGLAE